MQIRKPYLIWTGVAMIVLIICIVALAFFLRRIQSHDLKKPVDQDRLGEIFHILDTSFWDHKEKNLQLTNEALLLAQTTGDSNAMSEALYFKARILGHFENNDSIFLYSIRALQIAERSDNDVLIAKIKNNIANYYYIKDNYYLAMTYYAEVESIAEKLNNDYLRGKAYNGYGLVYMALNEYDKAKEYFEREAEMFWDKDKVSVRSHAITQINIGLLEMNRNNFSEASILFQEALVLAEKINDSAVICDIFNKLGLAFMAQDNYTASQSYIKQAINFSRCLQNNRFYGEAIYNLGLLNVHLNRPVEAEKLFLQAKDISAEVGFKSAEQRANLMLSELKEKQGQYRESLTYYKQYVALNDSILNSKIQKKISDFQWEIEVQKNKYELELLQEKYESQKIRNYAYVILIISGILIALMFYKYMKKSLKLQKIENDNLEERIKTADKINNLEKFKHLSEIESKNKELITLSLQLVSKKDMVNEISSTMTKLYEDNKMDATSYNNLNRIIRESVSTDKAWEQFKNVFEKVHHDFFSRLKRRGPELSENELRLCAYLKINLSNHEIAKIFNINPGTLKTNRYHIRKKLNLTSQDNLGEYLRNI